MKRHVKAAMVAVVLLAVVGNGVLAIDAMDDAPHRETITGWPADRLLKMEKGVASGVVEPHGGHRIEFNAGQAGVVAGDDGDGIGSMVNRGAAGGIVGGRVLAGGKAGGVVGSRVLAGGLSGGVVGSIANLTER